jgi:hypothetical protein
MKSRSELFNLWCSLGREEKIVIPQYERPDSGPSTQGYPSKVSSYAFQERD